MYKAASAFFLVSGGCFLERLTLVAWLRYAGWALAKSSARIGVRRIFTEHHIDKLRSCGFFCACCSRLPAIYVGWAAGQPSGWPVFRKPGDANPVVWLTPIRDWRLLGLSLLNSLRRARYG